MRFPWAIDGIPLPRNPDAYENKFANANAAYQTMADGSQRRLTAARLLSGSDWTFEWHIADQGLINFLSRFCSDNIPHVLTIPNLLPVKSIPVYLETPLFSMSKDVVDQRTGQGGHRQDIKIMARTSGITPYLQSAFPVPAATVAPSRAQMLAWFGGPTGTRHDGLPTWDGNPYRLIVGGSAAHGVTLSNLGTAPWLPKIRLDGPLSSAQIAGTYVDIDGTGQGYVWSYTGSALNAGDHLVYDTARGRVFTTIGGTTAETFAWSLNAVANPIPFPFFPAIPVGDFGIGVTVIGADGVNSAIDFSNAGQNTFGYVG